MTSERQLAAMPRVAAAVHELARELDLTNDELLAALGFLTAVGRAEEFILLSDVLGLSRLVDDQTHAGSTGTESSVLGPFYRPGSPEITNPGSVVAPGTPGCPLLLTGKVTDAAEGHPVAGAVVDLWQANGDGAYSQPGDRPDGWALRGRQRSGPDGRYSIGTVVPAHYTVKDDGPVGALLRELGRHSWRPAHIHILVTADGYRPLVTQVYVAGGPYLEDDAIDGVKGSLVAEVRDGRLEFDVALPRSPPAPDIR